MVPPKHDCLMNLSHRCEYLEGVIEDLTYKFKSLMAAVKEKVDIKEDLPARSPQAGTIRRFEVELPEMKRLRFVEDHGE